MNRAQRRKAKQEGLLDEEGEAIEFSLSEYLEEPQKVARRGEVAAVAERVYLYKKWQERRNRWYNRLLRKIVGWWKRHVFASPDPDGVQESDDD